MVIEVEAEKVLLVETFRRLPSEVADGLTALAARLANLAPSKKITFSDSWSDNDLAEFTAASIKRFESDEQEQH